MSPSKAVLLIGELTHSRKEWEELASLVTLKVLPFHHPTTPPQLVPLRTIPLITQFWQEYPDGSREKFISKCKSGEYDNVVGVYRSNASTSITGPFNKELIAALPENLKTIAHNGAGYDNVDISACTERGIRVSSTPIAVNEATADSTSNPST